MTRVGKARAKLSPARAHNSAEFLARAGAAQDARLVATSCLVGSVRIERRRRADASKCSKEEKKERWIGVD